MKHLILQASVGLLLSTTAFSAEIQVRCPAEYAGKDIQLKNIPKGWFAMAPTRLLLTSVMVILGPPKERGVLKGEHYKLNKKGAYEVRYSDLNSGIQYEKWIACGYGQDDFELAQPLDPHTAQCIVTYTPDSQGMFDIKAVCK
jgi:hypothetical protein